MKLKKVLAGALAVVMAVGAILVAPVDAKAELVSESKVYDATALNISATEKALAVGAEETLTASAVGLVVDGSATWNSAGGDYYPLTGDFDVTIDFYNDAYIRGTDNWFNFVFEVFNDANQGYTFRADRYGWAFGLTGTYEDAAIWNWDAFATMDNAVVSLDFKKVDANIFTVMVRVGENVIGGYKMTMDAAIPNDFYVRVGSDGGKIEVQRFIDNTSSATVGEFGKITWSSSNEEVATVDANGKVTAVGAGNANIIATCGTQTATCAVTVAADSNAVTGIEIEADKTEIKIGETAQITANVALENPDKAATEDTTVTYTSSDEKVATVDATGKVTAVAVGKATITAKVGEFTDTVEITVPAVPATALDVKVDKTELKVGESAQITATVTPEDTTDVITYESSNGKVVTVDENGKVAAVGAGVATVTVKAGEVTKTVEFAVNETSTIEMDDLSIDAFWTVHTPGIEIQTGKTYTFTFDAKSKSDTNAWHCPVYVVYTNSAAKVDISSADYKEYFVCRADNYGWTSAGNSFAGTLGDGYVFETNAVPESDDWVATYKATMLAGTKGTITAHLSGSNVIVVYDIAGVKSTSTIPVDTSKPVYLGLTGEQVDVTNIVAVAQTNNIANKGGAPILPFALVICGLGVVVIASRKKFAR